MGKYKATIAKPKDSFVFYRSFYEAIQDLPDNEKLEVYTAIVERGLNHSTPQLSGVPNIMFKLIKPQIDANWRRYVNGKKGAKHGIKGGAPIGNQNARKNNPKTTPNVNDNVNVNANGNDNDR